MANNRIVLHLDMNSYFATMEQQAYPNLRGKPVGVAGKGRGERTVIAGASIEAKKLGVKTAMSTWEAKRICPELIIIPANYDRYIFTSKRIFSIMERFTPKVEIFSIDEAFLELPAQGNPELETLSFDKAQLTPSNNRGVSSKQTQNIKSRISKTVLNFKNLNLEFIANLGFRISDLTVEDLAYLTAADIVLQIKQLIRQQIGEWVTCSAGISYGRTLAKLASEMQKPDGLTIIRKKDFPRIAQQTPIDQICGIGFRLTPRLNQMGVFSLADLGRLPPQQLTDAFGDFTGSWLHQIGLGIDDGPLQSFRELAQEKSIGHSYTLPCDVASREDAKKVILLLAERVGVRLRRKGLIGKTVTLHLRFFDGTGWGQQATQNDYLLDGYQIYQGGAKLLKLVPHNKPIRLIAVSITDLVKQTETTKPIFTNKQRYEQLIGAIDQINNRWGEFTVFRSAIANLKQRIFNLPDGRNKRNYLPEYNSFTKRI